MDTSPARLVEMTLDYIMELDFTQNILEKALGDEARQDKTYRDAKHFAWNEAKGNNVSQRESHVDHLVGPHRLERDLATGRAKAAMEKVRNKRQSLSALQTALNSLKEESQHSRVGPEFDVGLAERVEQERLRGGVPARHGGAG